MSDALRNSRVEHKLGRRSLVLNRKRGETLELALPDGGQITVQVLACGAGSVRLRTLATADVEIFRGELERRGGPDITAFDRDQPTAA